MSENSDDTKAGSHNKQGSLVAAAQGQKKPGGKARSASGARQVKLGRVKGDLIGVVVLAIGIAAMIGVSYLAYVQWYGGSQPQPMPEGEPTAIAAQEEDMVLPEQAREQLSEPLPEQMPDQSALAVPSEKQLEGNWLADFGSNKAFLQVSNGDAFQLIYINGAEGNVRKYSRGTFTYDSSAGALILQPDSALGEPKAVEGVTYKILTMRRYQVNLFRDKDGAAIYWKPGVIEGRSDQIHPLFLFSDRQGSGIKWAKSR